MFSHFHAGQIECQVDRRVAHAVQHPPETAVMLGQPRHLSVTRVKYRRVEHEDRTGQVQPEGPVQDQQHAARNARDHGHDGHDVRYDMQLDEHLGPDHGIVVDKIGIHGVVDVLALPRRQDFLLHGARPRFATLILIVRCITHSSSPYHTHCIEPVCRSAHFADFVRSTLTKRAPPQRGSRHRLGCSITEA